MHSVSVIEHQNLAEYNTMGLSARAKYFSEIQSVGEILEILNTDLFKQNKHLILGGGSNLLFKNDFDGYILHNNIKGRKCIENSSDHVLLKCGAGEIWNDVVKYSVNQNWGGIENLTLIPGSVGAAPIQNIGAYGVELKEVFEELEAVELQTGELKSFNRSECKFGYRDSIFKQELKGKYIITSVTLRLHKNGRVNTSYKALSEKLHEKGILNPDIRDISETVSEIRISKLPDPADIGNTGSFFKNPIISQNEYSSLKAKYSDIPSYPAGNGVKIPAAWLIDQCGWKGKRLGDAGVHDMQALVIVNYGKASGEEIWNLATQITTSVRDKFGVALIPEVNVV